jgi:hypothetical protein
VLQGARAVRVHSYVHQSEYVKNMMCDLDWRTGCVAGVMIETFTFAAVAEGLCPRYACAQASHAQHAALFLAQCCCSCGGPNQSRKHRNIHTTRNLLGLGWLGLSWVDENIFVWMV